MSMDTDIGFYTTLKRPSAFMPIVMSIVATAVVGVHIIAHGATPQVDEGAAAHLWQILMLAQVPIIAFFAGKWVPLLGRPALSVLAMQIAGALMALAPIYFLSW